MTAYELHINVFETLVMKAKHFPKVMKCSTKHANFKLSGFHIYLHQWFPADHETRATLLFDSNFSSPPIMLWKGPLNMA